MQPFIPYAVVLSIIACVAILLNVVVLYILTRRYHNKSFRSYIWMTLTVCDLFRCLVTAPIEIIAFVHGKYINAEQCLFHGHSGTFIETSSISLMVVLIAERYVRTCRPAAALSLYSKSSHIMQCVAGCFVYGSCWTFVTFLNVGQYAIVVNDCVLVNKENPEVVKVYEILLLVCVTLVPSAVITMCAVATFREFKAIRGRTISVFGNHDLAKHSTEEKQETDLIFVMAFVFTFTWIPYNVVQIFQSNRHLDYTWVCVAIVIGQSSCVSTPIFFMYTDKDFKRTIQTYRVERTTRNERAAQRTATVNSTLSVHTKEESVDENQAGSLNIFQVSNTPVVFSNIHSKDI